METNYICMMTNDEIQVNYYPLGEVAGSGDVSSNFVPREEKSGNEEMAKRGVVSNWEVTDSIIYRLRPGSDPAIMQWQFTGVFSASDYNTVAWTSGTLTFSDGTSYSISSGDTATIVSTEYIYFDKNVSETAFQTTTTAGNAVGAGKTLIGVTKTGLNRFSSAFVIGANVLTALSSTRVAFFDDSTSQSLYVFDFDGTNWAQVGNSFSESGGGGNSLVALSSTRIVLANQTDNVLRTYDFDGTNWSQVGNSFSIPNMANPALAKLSSSRIAYTDTGDDQLRTYDFDGTNWAQVGNSFSLGAITFLAITGMSSTRIAYVEATNDELRAYDFDGTNWTLTGSGLNLISVGTGPTLTTLSSSRIAFADPAGDQLRAYDFNGTTWSLVGNGYNLTEFTAGGEYSLATLTSTRVLVLNEILNTVARIYDFDGTNWSTPSTPAKFQIFGGTGGIQTDITIPDRSITYNKIASKTLTTGEISDNTIDAVLLEATNTEADNDIVTYDSASGGFTFNTPAEIITAGTNISWNGDAEINVDDAFILNTGDVGTGVHDYGGATSFEVPNGAGGTTVDAAGEVTIDTTSKTLNFYDGAAEVVLTPIQVQHLTIANPGASEDFSFFFTDKAITILKITAVLVGSASPSVTWTIRHDADRSAAGTEVVTGGTVTTSVTTGSVVTSFNDATVIANAFLWLETTAQSGTVNSINVTVFYKQDP
jgi:hypothetical protein